MVKEFQRFYGSCLWGPFWGPGLIQEDAEGLSRGFSVYPIGGGDCSQTRGRQIDRHHRPIRLLVLVLRMPIHEQAISSKGFVLAATSLRGCRMIRAKPLY